MEGVVSTIIGVVVVGVVLFILGVAVGRCGLLTFGVWFPSLLGCGLVQFWGCGTWWVWFKSFLEFFHTVISIFAMLVLVCRLEMNALKSASMVGMKAGRVVIYKVADVVKMFGYWMRGVPHFVHDICNGQASRAIFANGEQERERERRREKKKEERGRERKKKEKGRGD